MKTLKQIGAIGGAISLALCWPLAVGQIGQNVITDGLQHISSDKFKAELVRYDRGYLSSTVQTQLTVVDEQLKRQLSEAGFPAQLIVNSEIRHGLTSLSSVSTLPQYPALPLTITSTTSLNGNTQYSVSLDKWRYQSAADDAVKVALAPSAIKGTIATTGELTYSATIPSVELDFANDEKAQFTQVAVEGQGKQRQGFWIGQQKLSVGDITTLDTQGQTPFSVNKASYSFNSTLDEPSQRFSSQHVVQLGELVLEENRVKEVTIDFTLGEVDSQSFERLSSIYQSHPSMTQQAITQALPYVDTLFAKGFKLSLNTLSLKVGDGKFDSTVALAVPEGTANVVQDPSIILPSLTGHLSSFVSTQLAEAFPFIREGVDELLVMEMVTQNDQGYQLKADVKEGNLIFANGHEIPVIALLMPLMMGQHR